MNKIIKIVVRIYEIIINAIIFKYFNVVYTTSLKNIRGIPFIRNKGKFIIKKDVRINSRYSANPIGGQSFCTFVVEKNAELVIDEEAGISNSTIVCWKKIYIGKKVYIGGDCKIYDTDFHSINMEKRVSAKDDTVKVDAVIIRDGAFIGTGTIILKGVTIGKKAVIGAGSVVSKSVPDGEIWAGNPAKFIRKL